MFEWQIDNRIFHIRDIEGEREFHTVEDLQREAWSFSDLDIVPAATLIATQHAGGIVLGAFEGALMIGFAYAFPALEDGRSSMHSHMLAVKTDYRNFQAGFYLKREQSRRAIEMGLDEITWTFDPLQSLNAHLNFAKLGVISNRYIVNFYGEETSSPLHQGFGTDRLWVRWLLDSERVRVRLGDEQANHESRSASETRHGHFKSATDASIIESALIVGRDAIPHLKEFDSRLASNSVSIEIPHNINGLKAGNPAIGGEWRHATRAAFIAAMEAGFTATGFTRIESDATPRWFYLLEK